MRDDLHGAAEEVAVTLLVEQAHVDGALCHVGVVGEVLVDKALVVAEVEVGLESVFCHEDLAVLEGAHGARVDVEVGVHLLHGYLVTAGFEELAEGCGRDSLAEGGYDAAGHEDVLCHEAPAFHRANLHVTRKALGTFRAYAPLVSR